MSRLRPALRDVVMFSIENDLARKVEQGQCSDEQATEMLVKLHLMPRKSRPAKKRTA